MLPSTNACVRIEKNIPGVQNYCCCFLKLALRDTQRLAVKVIFAAQMKQRTMIDIAVSSPTP